jgi:uncharacterized membrane protein
MKGPMLIVWGLLALYALEIVLPLVALVIAYVKRHVRRAI